MKENKEFLEEFLANMLAEHTNWFEYNIENDAEDDEFAVNITDLHKNLHFIFYFKVKNHDELLTDVFLYTGDSYKIVNEWDDKYFWTKLYDEATKLIKL